MTLEKHEKDLQEKEVIVKAWEAEVAKREKTVTERERSATALEKDLAKREKDIEHKEGQISSFNKSKSEQLRGWELPEPKFAESAKKYRERVEPEVSGKIVRALKVVDDNAFTVKCTKEETDRELSQQKGYTEGYINQWQAAVADAKRSEKKYNDLRSGILNASSVDEINQIRTELSSNPSKHKGMTY